MPITAAARATTQRAASARRSQVATSISSSRAAVLVPVELGRQGRVDTGIDPEPLDLESQRGNRPLRMVAPAGGSRGGLEAEADDPRGFLA